MLAPIQNYHITVNLHVMNELSHFNSKETYIEIIHNIMITYSNETHQKRNEMNNPVSC